MDEIIRQLYKLAESDSVSAETLIAVLGLEWSGKHNLESDGVANLAASIEEYGHHVN